MRNKEKEGFRGVQFNVDEARGIVVAYIENREMDAVDIIRAEVEKESMLAYNMGKKYNIPRKFVAYARCHAPDVFNEEFGKNLARLRVEEQYNLAVARKLEVFRVHLCQDVCARIARRIDTAWDAAQFAEEQKIAMINFEEES